MQFLMTNSERQNMVSSLCSIENVRLSIIHRLRDNEVFLLTENDVIIVSPLGSAVYSAQ